MKKTLILVFVSLIVLVNSSYPQMAPVSVSGRTLYDKIKAFELNGGRAEVANLELTRDRVKMTFNGTFYFTSAIEGRVTGAVFVGQGNFRAELPPSKFEQDNVKRLLNAETVESDFKTAVLRFTDDTFGVVGTSRKDAPFDAEAQRLALDSDARVLRETGANLASRIAISLLNGENPGFFHAMFDGGKRERFSFVLDHQTRIPTDHFDINGGEKGLIYKYRKSILGNDTWLAFYSLRDYQTGFVSYSDLNNFVDITHYKLELDLRDPKSKLGLRAHVTMAALQQNLHAIKFMIGESLGEFEENRLKKQMRLKSAKVGGEAVSFAQEDWEGSMTIFLDRNLAMNEKFEVEFEMEGDFMTDWAWDGDTAFYPRSNSSWYPRQGNLDRSTFEMRFVHPKNLKVAAVGRRESEASSPEDKDLMETTYKMDHPVAFVTFAVGKFTRKTNAIKWENGDSPTSLEYNFLKAFPVQEDFIMAELDNSVRYFQSLFGKYPYDVYGAWMHPFDYGQGFASMVMIPPTDRATKHTFAFLAHETAHQWWGNIVAWRSYRDQWLSEGFAEYSGVLYTSLRKNPQASLNLLSEMRDSLRKPPETTNGLGKGKLYEIGPLILGRRLNSTKSDRAYYTLIYNKGGLVLRMLHFLFTDPQTGKGEAFFDMMKAFVERHRNGFASTDDFIKIVNERFPNTPLAKKFQLRDLNWFFRQWVYETHLPSYTFEYSLQDQPDGSCDVTGTLFQENVPESWAMLVPIRFSVGRDRAAYTTVAALGSKTQVNIKLPARPAKVELDPQDWVLSEKTKTVAK